MTDITPMNAYDFLGNQIPNSIGAQAFTDSDTALSPDERFAVLKELTDPYMNDEERDMVGRAYQFAKKWHDGQKRKSGEPFIVHPVDVAIILASLRMDAETICAALVGCRYEREAVLQALLDHHIDRAVYLISAREMRDLIVD